jgi:hypothetical protein
MARLPRAAIASACATPMNPAVTEAFALAIIGAGGPPAFAGMPGAGPDLALARRHAASVAKAIGIIRDAVPDAGSYVSEASFTDPDWQRRSFGGNYARLLNIKDRYDPGGLVVTHHGGGSERWSLGRIYPRLTAVASWFRPAIVPPVPALPMPRSSAAGR